MNSCHHVVSWENQTLSALQAGEVETALQAHSQAIITRGLDRLCLLVVHYNRLGNAPDAADRTPGHAEYGKPPRRSLWRTTN